MDREEVLNIMAKVTEQQHQAIVWALVSAIPIADRQRVLARIEVGATEMEKQERPVGAQLLRSLAQVLRGADGTPPATP
jgi:hypothetical protein